MARPITKQDLIKTANEQYMRMFELVDSMTDEEQKATFIFDAENEKEAHWKRDKNLRDVFVHLYEWHQLLLNWIETNEKGIEKPFLPEPYNWKTYGIMNVEMIWKKHQNTTYVKSREMLKESHDKVMKIIDNLSDNELFTKNYFSWTGGSTLGQYCVSATSSHYDWAIKKIKKQIKALQ
jgi:hypothetical protein